MTIAKRTVLTYLFNPACFRILFSVPGAKSSLFRPATVTRPRLIGCLNCLWLPRMATSIHPSFLNMLSTLETFIRRR